MLPLPSPAVLFCYISLQQRPDPSHSHHCSVWSTLWIYKILGHPFQNTVWKNKKAGTWREEQKKKNNHQTTFTFLVRTLSLLLHQHSTFPQINTGFRQGWEALPCNAYEVLWSEPGRIEWSELEPVVCKHLPEMIHKDTSLLGGPQIHTLWVSNMWDALGLDAPAKKQQNEISKYQTD